MKAPAGSVVALYWDGFATIEPGDILETATTQRRYEILAVRVQLRGRWAGRQHLRARVMADDEPLDGAQVHRIAWYGRSRRRA